MFFAVATRSDSRMHVTTGAMCRAGHFANICRSTARQLDTSTASWLTNVGTDGTIDPNHVFDPDEPVTQNTTSYRLPIRDVIPIVVYEN